MTPFHSAFEVVAFWGPLGVSLAAAVAWIVRHRKPRGKRRRDLFPLVFVVLAADIASGYARIVPLPHWVFYPGEALFVLGAAFTAWSYSHLGRYRLPYVEVLPEHQVVEDGPYRYIRHPGYLGAVVALFGLSLAVQSWVALLVSTTFENEAIATVEIEATQTVWMGDLGGGLGVDPAARRGRGSAAAGCPTVGDREGDGRSGVGVGAAAEV